MFKSPATRVYQLDGSATDFGAARCQVTSGVRDRAWIVCLRRATLVPLETWCHGWSAEIDGRATAIHSADGLFLDVTVPAGSLHLPSSFVPPCMNWAALGVAAVVARMLVPTARSASLLRVRR